MTTLDETVARLKRQYEGCFGCGLDNALGLQLSGFRTIDGAVQADWRPRPEYRGFGGMLHGGIVTSALDEIMAWTAMLTENVAVVTGTLEMRFRKPSPIDAGYLVEGRIRERRGRRVLMAGRLADATAGHDVATAEAMFLVSQELDLR